MVDLSASRRGNSAIGAIIVVAIIAIVALICFKPEAFRTPLQVPVSVTVRESYIGLGNVVQVRNTSNKTLTGVVITGNNGGMNSTITHRIGSIGPGQVTEVGWQEWDWIVAPGETISISADEYLPTVFSSAQLGVGSR